MQCISGVVHYTHIGQLRASACALRSPAPFSASTAYRLPCQNLFLGELHACRTASEVRTPVYTDEHAHN